MGTHAEIVKQVRHGNYKKTYNTAQYKEGFRMFM